MRHLIGTQTAESFASRYGVLVVVLLVSLLVLEELLRAYGGRAASRGRWLTLALAALLPVFVFVLYGRVKALS